MKSALVPLVLFLLLTGCQREHHPIGDYQYFIPAVVRSPRGSGLEWKTRVVLSNPSGAEVPVRAYRWPPAHRTLETFDVTLASGQTTSIPSLVAPLPAVSSLYVESKQPVGLEVLVESRRKPDLAPLRVPVLHIQDLARPGDTLRIEGLLNDDHYRSHYCFTMPWTEKDGVPYLIRLVMTTGKRHLLTETKTIPGVPLVVADPWQAHGLPPGMPLDLEVTLLGSNRGRKVVHGLWVYGIRQDKATGQSEFLQTRVERGSR